VLADMFNIEVVCVSRYMLISFIYRNEILKKPLKSKTRQS